MRDSDTLLRGAGAQVHYYEGLRYFTGRGALRFITMRDSDTLLGGALRFITMRDSDTLLGGGHSGLLL